MCDNLCPDHRSLIWIKKVTRVTLPPQVTLTEDDEKEETRDRLKIAVSRISSTPEIREGLVLTARR
jgi:hypothetical protein